MGIPLYSVVIPTYNRGHLLADGVASVFAQGLDDVEVIVVDDGSTDDTRKRVSGLGPRVRYAYQPNRGQAAARNRGIDLARGEMIAFLDSDDVWMPDKIATELDLFRRFPEADAVGSDSEFWREGVLEAASRFRFIGFDVPPGRDAIPLGECPPLWLRQSLFSTCCLTVRRAALRRIGVPAFEPRMRSHEDWEFEIRLCNRCQVVLTPRVLARVRRFADETRCFRAPLQRQARLCYDIVRTVRKLPPREPAIARKAEEMRQEFARKFARGARGRERLECLALAASELREGAARNALRVLGLGLSPHRGERSP
jgi:glycosyltransferase involved in cell wall biosynthesis